MQGTDRQLPAFQQAKAAAEALQALTWVVYSGPSCSTSQYWSRMQGTDRRLLAFQQARAAAEALQALTWVVYSGPSCSKSLSDLQLFRGLSARAARDHRMQRGW